MTSNPQQPGSPQPPNSQMFPNPPNRRSPADIAQAVADWIRVGLMIIASLICAACGLGVAYICLRALIWAIKLGQGALGI